VMMIVMNRMIMMDGSNIGDDDDNDTCMKYTVAYIFLLCCYMHQLMCFISCAASSSFEL
jgi:hypothetical protein